LFVVTSASPSEGKTTLIGNLGVAMAEAGQRVLMVDADLRAPRLAALFHISGKEGLSELFRSETPVDKLDLNQHIKPAGTPNLFLMTSGGGEDDSKLAGEMPFSRRIRELFVRLRREYDYVLIDTPPSIQFSDARLLGQISDGVILVIRSGVSSREAVALTVRRFVDDGVQIVGTILNHWQPTRGEASYGGYYMNGYKGENRYSPKA
jgi:capsular exopolysaccharide synthesis family protein